MQTNQPIRWGIVGCGDVCEIKSAPAYQQVEGFELAAVMSRSLDKAQDFASRHGVKKFCNSARQLINDPELDAIYIATPPDSHYQFVLDVAAAGKICCVEKPMALNYQQCLLMQAAFEAKQLPLFVAYYRRCLPAFKKIKACIDQGEIGQIRHIDWQYSRPPSQQDTSQTTNWRTQAEVAPGGYFDDIACHGLDIMLYLNGDIVQASGTCGNQLGLYSSFDAIAACFEFANGATGTGNWNFASWETQDKVKILGSSGSIEFSIFEEYPAILTNSKGSKTLAMPKPVPIQKDFVQAIHDHLTGVHQHPSLASSAAHTSWVMEQILTHTG